MTKHMCSIIHFNSDREAITDISNIPIMNKTTPMLWDKLSVIQILSIIKGLKEKDFYYYKKTNNGSITKLRPRK